jgi:hypothetical protein
VIVVFAPADSSVEIVATGDEDVTVADITGAIEVTAEAGIEFDAPPGAAFTLDAVANSGSIEDGIGLDAEPTANGQGETLEASRGDGAQAIVLRAGAGITLSR